jgi:hypothetical protein
MPLFTNPADLARHLEEAAAFQLRLAVVQAQADLGSAAVSPIDTGRFRSSWFASVNRASDETAPEGANSPRNDADALRVQAGDEVHLTNSLPYAEALCVEGRVVNKPRTWFKSFRDSRVPKILDAAGLATKQRFQL